jgi:uncharacterized protein YkwD
VASTVLLAPATGQARKPKTPLVNQINEVRQVHGVPPVRYSRSLARSSLRFARYLARNQQFAHGSPIWASSRFSGLGEILALTTEKVRRRKILRSWLQSPSHRAVVLDPAFRYVGAGRAWGDFGATPALVWTVHFGR